MVGWHHHDRHVSTVGYGMAHRAQQSLACPTPTPAADNQELSCGCSLDQGLSRVPLDNDAFDWDTAGVDLADELSKDIENL